MEVQRLPSNSLTPFPSRAFRADKVRILTFHLNKINKNELRDSLTMATELSSVSLVRVLCH